MSPPSSTCASPRPSAVANEAIRVLAKRAWLTAAERRELARLWMEYARALEAEKASM